MVAIRTRSYLSDDATLKAHGIERREVFMCYRAPTDDGLGLDLLMAVDVFSPSNSTDRDDWMLVFTCPVCTIRFITEDSEIGGWRLPIKVFDPKRLADLDPWTIQQVQTRCSLQVQRGAGSTKEFDILDDVMDFDGKRYRGLVSVSPNMACPYCPEAQDGRQFSVFFPRPGLAIQDPRYKLWSYKPTDLAKASGY